MALAMAQLGQGYGFPVYVNVNLTDAKGLDVQAGVEKAGCLLVAIVGGADPLGHGGIVGPDQGAGLDWLVVDDLRSRSRGGLPGASTSTRRPSLRR